MYTFDPIDETTTELVKWDNDEDEIIDEPNAINPLEPLECSATRSMDFDSEGSIYAIMICDDEPTLAKIGFPLTVTAYSSELDEDTEQANLTLITYLKRNTTLYDVYHLGSMEWFDPLTLSPFDFDFLLGNTYGTVTAGFDSLTATVTNDGNFISTDDTAEISICDNAELSLDGAELFIECNNTSISVDSGSIVATLIPDDEEISTITTTLNNGDIVIFDSEKCRISNNGVNDLTLLFDGDEIILPSNKEFSCAAADHYLGYDTKLVHNHGDDDHSKTQITLDDIFSGTVQYDVKKLDSLYNPVDKNNEGISDENSHLVSYDIKESKGESKFKKIEDVLVTNQFGDLTVDITNPKTLMVPSFKDHFEIPDEPINPEINHFKCYDAKESKDTPKFEKRNVSLVDQFGNLNMEVYKPKTLCSPVDKNDEGVIDEENFLMCYDLKEIKGEPKFEKVSVFTNNQFGPEELEAKKPKQLCVPSTITYEIPGPTVITGTHDGNIDVDYGEIVIIDGATVNGIINNEGGDVSMINDCVINGNVKSNDGIISIDSCIVNGNVRTEKGLLTITNDSQVTGNVNAKQADFVTITNNDESFGGHLRVENAGTVDITNNNVAQNLRVKDSGDVTLSDNTVGGHLRSFDNDSTIVSGNTVTGNLNTDGTDTVTITGNTSGGNIRAADSVSVEITDNTSVENLRVKGSSNVNVDQNQVGDNLRVLENNQVSVTNNHANNNINIKSNTDCTYSANTADNQTNIKDCTEV